MFSLGGKVRSTYEKYYELSPVSTATEMEKCIPRKPAGGERAWADVCLQFTALWTGHRCLC